MRKFSEIAFWTVVAIAILNGIYHWVDPYFWSDADLDHPILLRLFLLFASAAFVLGFVYLLVRVIKIAWRK